MSEENMNPKMEEGNGVVEVKKESFIERGFKKAKGFVDRNWKFFVGAVVGAGGKILYDIFLGGDGDCVECDTDVLPETGGEE